MVDGTTQQDESFDGGTPDAVAQNTVATGLAALAFATQNSSERKQLLEYLQHTTHSDEQQENVLGKLVDASDSEEPTVKKDPKGQTKTIVAQLQFPRVMKDGSQGNGHGSMLRH